MGLMTAALLLGAFFGAAVALTAGIRRIAARRLVDVPNERSLHKTPTPRGGGGAFAILLVVGALAFAITGVLEWRFGLTLALGGAVVAGLGLLDDIYTLGNRVRLIVWLGTAAVVAYVLGGLPSLELGTFTLPLGALGFVIALVGIVWVVNLYNFMDGVDGLAGSQAVIVSGAASALLWVRGEIGLALLAAVAASAVLGFLVWNWPPAKIFMGDIGSGFLGFTFAVLAIWTSNQGILDLQVWVVLMGVFLVDATLTMARRMLAGEKWSTAHRSHAYQRVVTAGYSHASVTMTVIAIDSVLVAAAFTMVLLPHSSAYVLGGVLTALGAGWLGIVTRWPAAQRAKPTER